ncbi:MAG: glycosyltransferase family 2 protein [Paenibacillus dendritiformis]|uniref:glycosyltransferase family 2 protein n=1 Tax=uncultured Paenibacillus sp. TaxID=227322 RepID=UPI0025D15E79|nr:glycosyltransferase family 2 protein [uncultured Paenibacillus sp.]MDU5141606.1 glycosyltransferase family 2 protein [Paenibacillus dendritiformis]
MAPKISVVVPVYNTENYLDECLYSIESQTMKDIEVLIVNDCTPDNSMLIAEKYARKDTRFKILNHNINSGPGAARNTGMDIAEGTYITFLDSDDVYPLNALENMYNCIDCNNADMALGRMFQKKGPNGKLHPVQYIESRIKNYLRYPYSNIRLIPSYDFFTGSLTNRIFKLSLFQENGIRFLDNVYHEDIPPSLETWFYSKKIVVCPYIIHFRTIREDDQNLSITQTFNRKAYFDRDIILQSIYDFCLRKASPENDLTALTIEIIKRINSTTENMLSKVIAENYHEITKRWYPKYKKKSESMLEDIQVLQTELFSEGDFNEVFT